MDIIFTPSFEERALVDRAVSCRSAQAQIPLGEARTAANVMGYFTAVKWVTGHLSTLRFASPWAFRPNRHLSTPRAARIASHGQRRPHDARYAAAPFGNTTMQHIMDAEREVHPFSASRAGVLYKAVSRDPHW
jgi:hypothetical protein